MFLRAHLAPKYNSFEEGEARAEKTQFLFWSKFSKKCLKTHFLAFFQKFFCGADNLLKMGFLSDLGELR